MLLSLTSHCNMLIGWTSMSGALKAPGMKLLEWRPRHDVYYGARNRRFQTKTGGGQKFSLLPNKTFWNIDLIFCQDCVTSKQHVDPRPMQRSLILALAASFVREPEENRATRRPYPPLVSRSIICFRISTPTLRGYRCCFGS